MFKKRKKRVLTVRESVIKVTLSPHPVLPRPLSPVFYSLSILLLSSLCAVISAHMLLRLLIVWKTAAASWVFKGNLQGNQNTQVSSSTRVSERLNHRCGGFRNWR